LIQKSLPTCEARTSEDGHIRLYVGDVDVGRWVMENGHAAVYVPRR